MFSFPKSHKKRQTQEEGSTFSPISTVDSPFTSDGTVRSPIELVDPLQMPTDLGRKPSLAGTIGSTFGLPMRNASVSTSRKSDPLGLTVLYEPEVSPSLDIIFVHGLGGTSRATWAHERNPQYFWPEKWLPLEPEIRMARILSFGYNANWQSTGPAPITGISDFAKELLYSMKFAKGEGENLEELELGQWPIIFIVHSMGGLVVKSAYILGQNDRQYSHIVSSIRAILFLATPHRGSNLAEVLNKILTVSLFNHSPRQYITELQTGSQTVADLNEQFRHIAPKLDILSFYETLETAIGLKRMMVVEKDSATLGHREEISKGLQADHHTVCKFDSTGNANYISVRNALKSLVSGFRSAGQSLFGEQGKAQIEHLQILFAVSEAFHEDLEFFRSRWTPGTCEWILSHPSYNKWLSESERAPTMMWLHALPATGKSVLSSFIANQLLEKESVCAYFFFRFSDESKRSPSACLRSIAFQIARQLPAFRRALKSIHFATKTLEKTDAKTIWDKIFVRALFKLRFATPIYWVVDALDESDNPEQLVELMRSVSNSLTRIKILLVSRQTPELITNFDRLSTVLSVAYLPLESTKRDIGLFVEKEVGLMRADPEFKVRLVDKMVRGANGNFLWASLAMREVSQCNTEEDIDETLSGIPSGMEDVYQRMERTIIEKNRRPRDRELGQSILTWTVCSRRPLLLSELAQALDRDYSRMLNMELVINRVCGQFVIVDSKSGQLVMVHQTARDHITSTTSELGVNITNGHEKLLTKCLTALNEKHHLPREAELRPGDRRTSLRGELFDYAITSWAYHLDKISPKSDAPLILLAEFLKGNSVLHWIVALAQRKRLRVIVSSAKSMSLYVRRKRGRYASTNPMDHRLRELDLVDSWATDLLKLIGKFGLHLAESPNSIYQEIPPFCPKDSMIYKKQSAPRSGYLTVEGLSRSTWDDGLAKISLQPATQGLVMVCTGDYFAVLTGGGVITLYNSTTFETRHVFQHGEEVSEIKFSHSSRILVSYGYRTTKIWSVDSGQETHQIKNPVGSGLLAIEFSTGDTQLIIGSADRYLRIAQLTDDIPSWKIVHRSLLRTDTALDRPVHNIPWRMALNSDASRVAVAYRGSPLCVWSLEDETLLGQCMRDPEYVGNRWTVVDQMVWHPKCEEILGLYMGGQVFKWNPYTNSQQELEAEGSILACSPEGKFFTIGDSQGTIKLYNFHHFAMVYKLSYDEMITNICFSPDSKRLYDLRGSWCNVWEPNALLAGEENGEESDLGSENASIPTDRISEASVEVRAQITAIAVQFGGRYHAFGNDAGAVNMIDSSIGNQDAVELWKSPLEQPIAHLDWSSDGKFLACVETAGRIVVKQVHRGKNLAWTAQPVFEVRVAVSPQGVQQVLLNHNGTTVLIKNGPMVTIQHVKPTAVNKDPITINSVDTKWIQHPTERGLLLSFSPEHARVHKWDDLSEVMTIDLDKPSLSCDLMTDPHLSPETASIQRICKSRSGDFFLLHTMLSGKAHKHYFTSAICTPSSSPHKQTADYHSLATDLYSKIPNEIQSQIEIPLGIISRQRLVFLDKQHWMCSWSLKSNGGLSPVNRHYFLPKDWLNARSLELCALLPDGVLLIPHHGEMALIKSQGLSNG